MKKEQVQPGTKPAPEKYYIIVNEKGPYLVYGQPPLKQQFIMPDEAGEIWYFKAGAAYQTTKEPTALCRCGMSAHKPYCDGAHLKADWDPRLTASEEPILEDAIEFRGPEVTLTDNEKYCAFARFCDAKGQVWNLVGVSGERARDLTVREANHCPAGRLSTVDKGASKPHEPQFKPELGLIEDPAIRVSGPLWVRGGIRIQRENGFTYEIRNRVTLCRCGQSANKPFCDGTHASMRFTDGLPGEPLPDGEEF